jgi:antitoxin ParD1/3/4
MRTNIDIDDDLMSAALAAGPYRTKREAVEAGLKLLQRQAAARKLLELEGKVAWGWGDEDRLDGQPNWQADGQNTAGKSQAGKPARQTKATRKVAA